MTNNIITAGITDGIIDRRRQDADSLEEFLLCNSLPQRQSIRNLEESVLEIKSLFWHVGNALLLTENGYFITAHHCLTHSPKMLRFHDGAGNKYMLEEICQIAEEDDLVLAKLRKEGPVAPRQYNIQIDESASLHKPIMHLSRWKGELARKYGLLKSKNSYGGVESPGKETKFYFDHASARMSVINGDSGGAVINAKGDLLGLLCSGSKYTASYVESDNIVRLIQNYITAIRS